jgi:RimJ/RimL family protein N-acetyltransferase
VDTGTESRPAPPGQCDPDVLGRRRLPTLEGRRVRLRWLAEDDVGALFEIFSDPAVARFWSAPPITRRAQARELLRDVRRGFRERDLFEWGLALRRTDEIVGTVTLWRFDVENRHAEVGFALARRAWGRGLMREGLNLAIGLCFGPLGLRRLEADVDPRNEASLRLLEGLGFRREGLMRERWNTGGELQDGVLLGLLAREWTGTEGA